MSIDGVGSLFNENFITDSVTYYANKGNKEAIKWMTAIFKVGLRQSVYNSIGYELPKLEINPIKTFPKYERTVSDWLEERLDKDYKLVEREYRLPSGKRIDFLLNGYIILEVKRLDYWTTAVGQVLAYKQELKALGHTRTSTQLELFGDISFAEQKELRSVIIGTGVNKVGFITDINLKEDRR